MQLLQVAQVVQSVDLIVVQPQLLKGACQVIQVTEAFQLVATKAKDLDALKLGHGNKSFDSVRRQAQLLAYLKLVDRLVQTVNRCGQLAH